MTISVILRLTVPALREGRLAGHAEIVADGTRLVIRDAADLVDLMLRHLEPDTPPAPGHAVDPGRDEGPHPPP